uniref:Rit1 DUSP-like domain-containing protein n=1 Tax=Arundo donax TaxID=35708 RepID=A0A0A9FNE1_ARUDO
MLVGPNNDRFSIMKKLAKAVDFVKKNLVAGRQILVCCQNGKLANFTYVKEQVVSSVYRALLIRMLHASCISFVAY